MSSEFPHDPFWDFSLAVYGTEGVPAACLILQERYHIDVNLLLWCVWRGAEGCTQLDTGDLAAAEARVDDWHVNVVRHIRWLRRHLKSAYPHVIGDLQQSLRASLQKIEIDAEHLEQLTLGSLAREAEVINDCDVHERVTFAASNAALYLKAAGAGSNDDADACAKIVTAAFAQMPASDVRETTFKAMK
jgi:uncharacterized protein (TIGR02444 family)